MEHATKCLADGYHGIPDRHGEFFLAPLATALDLYRPRVDQAVWQTWRERLQTPLDEILEDQRSHTNNWRTYAMKGEWLRSQLGLVDRDAATAFIADAWLNRTQRERIVADRWNMYQDWSSDPQSHAVEAVGRGNLLALVAAGYGGPGHQELERCVRRGTEASLHWQDPTGQCPPNGRTDNHVFNDVLYQLAFEVMAEDALARGDLDRAGKYRRAAMLSFRSIERWRHNDSEHAGSYFVTKNQFDPAERVGYQPASQITNYNGAIAYHLAEAYLARRHEIAERPVPTEIGGYLVEADPRFASLVANAGGMQLVANLRGDTAPKYGQYWTPLGVVRFSRVGWDSRLGPPDGAHDAASGRAVSFAPTWREGNRWVRLAERAEHYRGTARAEFVHPLLVRFEILYHTVTGVGGPTFHHVFTVTPDGVLATLHCDDEIPFGVTLPIVVDDGRPLDVDLEPPCLSTAYPDGIGPAGDAQNFVLLDSGAETTAEEPIRTAVGWLRPVRATNHEQAVSIFVYPQSDRDPSAEEVLASFQRHSDGHQTCLGNVRGNLYVGRTSAGGRGQELELDGGGITLSFDRPCDFLLQRDAAGAIALEVDRPTGADFNGRALHVNAFEPLDLRRDGPR